MSFLRHVRQLYSLDTLDTRFTNSSTAPLNTSKSTPANGAAKEDASVSRRVDGAEVPNGATRSLWNTTEFYLYYVVFLFCVPNMIKAVYDVSKPSHPTYSKYESLLSPGWIPGRKVDNSDAQYSHFRDNVPYMLVLVVVHPLLRRLYDTLYRSKGLVKAGSAAAAHFRAAAANARLDQRLSYDSVFAFIFLLALHGTSALKVFLILYINYYLAKHLPRNYIPAATWAFNIGILFANELCSGYPYSRIADVFLSGPGDSGGKNWGHVLDGYGGLMSRWEILFNITVLRLISFNMDYYWSAQSSGSTRIEKKQLDPSNLPERDRVSMPAEPDDFSFRNYVAYALYAPLYLAGPILTFNDYISQARYQPKSITYSRTLLYAIRFLICLLTMEVMLHYCYAVAISKAQPAWEVYSPFQVSMLGYFNLHIIWLKLLLPWRFFRLWALLDGIDPPENMVRCVSDNFSTVQFWRSWHKSFNKWLLRYIYIPLGGSARPGAAKASALWTNVRAMANFLIIFTFVALWHDIQLRLLVWGWMITFFVLPEVLARILFPAKRWKGSETAYRWLCGLGAVGNILMMMAANLIGFAIGVDGFLGLVRGIVGSAAGVVYLLGAMSALFVGTQIMFEHRAEELRNGVNMKC